MPLFPLTVFLSAFLLFQIQPIVAKMILPWFGGSSSVWSACMVFFQAALLVGYAYVHWLGEKVAPHRQPIVHGVLLLASLAMLPVAADPAWKGTALDHPSAAVLAVLAGAVGVPYLLLSTTGPLMQVWYARASAARGIEARPYRLYALSNLASMLALLTYPVMVEPVLSVGAQADGWSLGYVAFVVACLGSAWLGWQATKASPAAGTGAVDPSTGDDAPRPSLAECLLWIGLSATASIVLLALTRHLTQDVAPVPFLWVLPLAIYLLSFILCFDAPRYYVRPFFLAALPVALLALDQAKSVHTGVPMLIAVFSASLFVICMVCHGELVRRKPPVRHLTLFYLMLSLGGVLGGMLVGLVAPAVFNAYFELPIGLFLCAALVVGVTWREVPRGVRVALGIALVLYGARLGWVSLEYVQGYRQVVRNFYSQTRVEDVQDPALGPARVMLHGRINHGEQYLSDRLRRVPSAYFCERSGIGRAFRSLPQDRPLKLGVLGLGIGVLAAYGRPGDEMRIYEINEQVLDLAQREFTYLSDSPAKIVPVLGDGRLMLEREPAQKFDLLVMDAFSGDSVPTHLVTLEAIRTYLGQMNPDGGLLAFNITNRFLDLRPVMAAAAAQLGRVAVAFETVPTGQEDICRRSHWVLMLTPEQVAKRHELLQPFEPIAPRPGFEPWTDTYSNLLKILKPRE
jgi:hypothetical protein